MQNIFTNIKCSEIILYNANENWYIILYDLFSRLCYIATCGPFCKDATHMSRGRARTRDPRISGQALCAIALHFIQTLMSHLLSF